ncbi:peptidoglycan-binding protein [Alkalihalobacillus sp. 1P02AB]|uniref:peptidoglycan-binding protein n=1 Tax=Alkalihalobacillus sp. 1P02AB TaxID=3132260 RepID=UPI0039A49936
MKALIEEYKITLKQLKNSREGLSSEQTEILSGMLSDLKYAIDWMSTGRSPQARRGIERKAAYQRERPVDPITMQQRLIAHGQKLPKFGADSDFGAETLAAVKGFQRDKGLTVDGIVGPKTWAELNKTPQKNQLLSIRYLMEYIVMVQEVMRLDKSKQHSMQLILILVLSMAFMVLRQLMF